MMGHAVFVTKQACGDTMQEAQVFAALKALDALEALNPNTVDSVQKGSCQQDMCTAEDYTVPTVTATEITTTGSTCSVTLTKANNDSDNGSDNSFFEALMDLRDGLTASDVYNKGEHAGCAQ